MAWDNSHFDYDSGYYEFMPGRWLAGKVHEHSLFTWSSKAIERAVNVDLKDSDCIIATYPKTGEFSFKNLD